MRTAIPFSESWMKKDRRVQPGDSIRRIMSIALHSSSNDLSYT